jgi:hypothetical protein
MGGGNQRMVSPRDSGEPDAFDEDEQSEWCTGMPDFHDSSYDGI